MCVKDFPIWIDCLMQDRCLAHVINPATIDIMAHITKIAVVETKSVIWDYNPADPVNFISNGGLDVIATIQMLAIKVSIRWECSPIHTLSQNCQIQASGSQIKKFNEPQMQTEIAKPIKIPLHSNVH